MKTIFSKAAYCLLYTLSATASPSILDESSTCGVSKFVDNNGVNIHYVVHGSGEPLLLQHGFPDNEATWNTFQVAEFAADYKVITPTLRGYPPSDVPPGHGNYTYELLVSDIAAVLKNEGVNETILVGHDIGGVMMQYFALAFPELVKALVLTNTAILPTWIPLLEFDPDQQKMSHYTLAYYSYLQGQPKNISTIVENIWNDTYRQEITDYLEASPISGMLAFYNENYPGPPYGRKIDLDGLTQSVPTCIIWGEDEPYFSAKSLDGLEEWFSDGVRLVTIPHAGHWSFRDQPARWNAELGSFLEFLKGYKFPVTLE